MRAKKSLPTQQQLLEKFAYNEETGELTLKQCHHKSRIGTVCGILQKNGYVTVSFEGKKYYAHRVIWRMMTGDDPGNKSLDHKNRNRSDNRWSNLRLASALQQEHNKTNAKGYEYNGGSFRARIRINGVRTHIGTYETKAEAQSAYEAKCKELRGEFAPY